MTKFTEKIRRIGSTLAAGAKKLWRKIVLAEKRDDRRRYRKAVEGLELSPKVRAGRSDIVLRAVSYAVTTLWIVALLFPLYWLLLTSVKDQADAYRSPPSFVPTVPNEFILDVDSTGREDYGYETFKRESTLLAWYVFENETNINMGKLTVRWIKDGKSHAATTLTNRAFVSNRNSIFYATVVNAYLILVPNNFEACTQVIEDSGGYSQKVTKVKSYKESSVSEQLVSVSNSIELTDRQGNVVGSPFSFGNPVSACGIQKSFSSLFTNYVVAFTFFSQDNVKFTRFLWNSSVIAFLAVAFQWVLIAAAAYGISKLVSKKLGNVLMTFFIATMMIPSIVYIVPLYSMIQRFNLVNNLWAVVLPGVPNAVAMVLFKGFFDGLPGDVVEAARIDGASEYRIYLKMVVPLSFSVFGVITILVFTGNWNDIVWPSMVLQNTEFQTFPVIINRMMGQMTSGKLDYPLVLAMSAIAALPTFILYIFFQKQMSKGLVFSGVKG